MSEHLTLTCVADPPDSVTVSGPYGDVRSNIAINVTEGSQSCAVYLRFEDARRLRDWLTATLPAESTKEGETP